MRRACFDFSSDVASAGTYPVIDYCTNGWIGGLNNATQTLLGLSNASTRIVAGRTSRETAYLTVSLPAGLALPVDLQTWIRRHWHIENKLHHVRDVTFREDLHQARSGVGPRRHGDPA